MKRTFACLLLLSLLLCALPALGEAMEFPARVCEDAPLLSIAIVQIWLSTGYEFIFLLSAVRGISQDIIESASLEGATPLQMLFKIYLPLTSPTMFYLIITDISFSVMMMSLSNVLTNGGPQNSTITMMQYIYKQISGTANYTNANPAAIIAFLIAFAATMAGFAWEKKGVHYQ